VKIIEAADYKSMSRKAANIISAQVILYPKSVLGLATGSTPLGVYRQLIDWFKKGDIDFSSVNCVNLDEYCGLRPDHPQSYHYYMHKNFFDNVNIPEENIHIPNGLASDTTAECMDYDRMIADLGGIDLQLLGLGITGHIGFNEPSVSFDKTTHKVALEDETILANSKFFDNPRDVPEYAITMGIKSIMQAKKILMLVSGAQKASILEKSLFGPVTPLVQASILQFHPDVTVVADAEALSLIRLHGQLSGQDIHID
jgi:glucosamine-6-phosphate deaminase